LEPPGGEGGRDRKKGELEQWHKTEDTVYGIRIRKNRNRENTEQIKS
jgi:hypothetical protein